MRSTGDSSYPITTLGFARHRRPLQAGRDEPRSPEVMAPQLQSDLFVDDLDNARTCEAWCSPSPSPETLPFP